MQCSRLLLFNSLRRNRCGLAFFSGGRVLRRNRFTPIDELEHLNVTKPNEWQPSWKEDRKYEDAVTTENLVKIMNLRDQKTLENYYERANDVFFEAIQFPERLCRAELYMAVRIVAAAGEIGKVRFLLSELRRQGHASLISDQLYTGIIFGVRVSSPLDVLLSIFYEDIVPSCSAVPEEVFIEMVSALVHFKAKRDLEDVVGQMFDTHKHISIESYDRLMESYIQLREFRKAWKIFEQVDDKFPDQINVKLLGRALEVANNLRDIASAKKLFSRSQLSQSFPWPAVSGYVSLLIDSADLEIAIGIIKSDRRFDGSDGFPLRCKLIEMLLLKGRDSLAMRTGLSSLSNEEHMLILEAMIRGYVKRGDRDKATDLIRRSPLIDVDESMSVLLETNVPDKL
mmetsp:Transcript_5391/g.16084  ORF Transcript_5391/g.16084 Transcript_5391/m.16084 type:complete len:398 (-) Transcript_5391:2710-3903(-)